mmetsp:Transcript_50236/g.106739  ORF Transcript_50236/g.106739 Transcript_50236/m.106739 type:complete len:411 (+) Transcript_50236:326-1558(+)
MVEEAEVGEGHSHAVLVASLDNLLIGDGATRLSHELDAQLLGMVNGVPEGEEGIRGNGNTIELLQERGLVRISEGLRSSGKVLHPLRVFDRVHVALDVSHSGVDSILSLHTVVELETHDLRVESQPPSGHLPARKLNAINSALLTGTDANHHAVLGVADRVGLGVLDGDHAQDHVELGLLREVLFRRGDLLQEAHVADLVVPLLHEADAASHSELHVRELEVVVRLQHDEFAALLGLQNLQGLRLEARSDDTIRDLNLEDAGGGHIDLVGDSHEVAERAQGVGISRSHIGSRDIRQWLAPNLVDVELSVAQGNPDGSTSRRDVLEGCSRRLASALGELMHQLPGVDGIQQIDVPRGSCDHLEGEFLPIDGAETRWQLMRVAAVLERSLNLEADGLSGGRLCDLLGHPLAD